MPRKPKAPPPDTDIQEPEERIHYGQRLKEFRIRRGWTQSEMAKKLGLNYQQDLSLLENDPDKITANHLARLRNYGMDVEYFLTEEMNGTGDTVSRFLEQIKNLHGGGVEDVYPDRHEALKSFHRYIDRERNRIDLTGSSLKGLLTMHPETFEAMKKRIQGGTEARILLTHPAFAVLRAFVEGRDFQMIVGEIGEAFGKYCKAFKEIAPNRVSIHVVLHPPTIFGIFLTGQGKALIDPYTLTVEAFSTQTLVCRDTGNPKCMFRQYHLHHFENPFSNALTNQVSIELDEIGDIDKNPLMEACKSIDKALNQYKERGLKGTKRAEQKPS